MMAQGRVRSINSIGFGGVAVLESFCEEVYLYAHVFFIIAVLYHKICGDLEISRDDFDHCFSSGI